jgi:hypothetical protein
MASKAKPATPEGQPCEKCGVVECGTARIPVCCGSCTHT